MSLTEAQKLARSGKLTASRVSCLMTGDKAKIMAVWRELCGDPTFEEENLDDVWPVQLGVATEALNLRWYTKVTGNPLTKQGEVVQHHQYAWAAATLDGFDETIPGPVECKTVGGFETIEKVIERYQPQCQWQMEVTGTIKCMLSVIEGGRVPRHVTIDRNPEYADELMARALRLMECVWNMQVPVELEPVVLPHISRLKDYDMHGNNEWAVAACDWLGQKEAAIVWENSIEKIKGMVPNDAASATGYGIVVKRDKAHRISIKPVKSDKPGPEPKQFRR